MRLAGGVYAENLRMSGQSFGVALGHLIRRKRRVQGLTQVQLAEDAYGTSAKTRRISEIESGQVAAPHPKTIDPIIVALGISPEEIDECAKGVTAGPDANLDRAFREARNLIDAIAAQFELSRPNATLAELEDFLREKAREWAALRDRLGEIEATTEELSGLISQAQAALDSAEFNRVDDFLAEAEELQQRTSTLVSVRKQVEIRLMRADSQLFAGNSDSASAHYIHASNMLRPFAPREAYEIVESAAHGVYETSRRSFRPAYEVAAQLLLHSLGFDEIAITDDERGKCHYRLSLVYRNASAAKNHAPTDLSDEALSHAEKAVSLIPDTERFDWAAAQTALANCLHDRGLRKMSADDLDRASQVMEETIPVLVDDERLIRAHANNTLGAIFLARAKCSEEKGASGARDIERALHAFQAAVDDSEASFAVDAWSAAKGNVGECLSKLADEPSLEPGQASFLRIRSIASYASATEAFTENAITLQIASLHLGLAKAILSYAKSLPDPFAEPYLRRALGSLNIAALAFDKQNHPDTNAWISYTAASIFEHHSSLDGAESVESDLLQAKMLFGDALEFYSAERTPDVFAKISQKLTDIDGRLKAISQDGA
jgi:transcriptional regulator with XRE-family HTH domain